MLARALPSILPDLSFDEALQITKIHSVAGTLGEEGIVTQRPFRTPHHTATTVSLCGGGNKTVHPGEISLAHGGVLFLDELPEYNRSALEALRQPLEDGVITVFPLFGHSDLSRFFYAVRQHESLVPAAITAARSGDAPACPTIYAAIAPEFRVPCWTG